MRLRRLLLRIFGYMSLATLSLLLINLVIMTSLNYRFRHRAESLLADFHSIRLNQSTWSDAQHVITRWGKSGKAQSTCSSTDCIYVIDAGDPRIDILSSLSKSESRSSDFWLRALGAVVRAGGGRLASFSISFTVQDGKIVAANTRCMFDFWEADSWSDFGVLLTTDSESNLRSGEAPFRGALTMANHPDYYVKLPAGMLSGSAFIFYSPFLPQAEVNRLTDFNFACLTRMLPCASLDEILPAAAAWNNPKDKDFEFGWQSYINNPKACTLPDRARGRDFGLILEVETISPEKRVKLDMDYFSYELKDTLIYRVRLLKVIRGSSPWPVGAEFIAAPFERETGDPRRSEHLVPGHRYLLFLDSDQQQQNKWASLDWCGIVDDNPDAMAQVLQGIREDIPVRNDRSRQSF